MPLSRHISPEELLQRHQERYKIQSGSKFTMFGGQPGTSGRSKHVASPYINRYTAWEPIPKYVLPANGVDAKSAYQIIHDDLDLDGRPNLNLASFVSTFVEDESLRLTVENLTKNLADSDEYPALMDIHSRCISILGNMWNASPSEKPIGSATTGSSEAIHLGGLAMKRRWQEKRKAEGKDTSNPNIIMGANAQVALEKFARYFEVECRLIPVSEESNHCLDASKVLDHVDENTIGIFVIMGSTYTGHYEPVEQIAKMLDKYQEETGIDIPIHIDAASGGFVAPFCHPHTVWDFRLKRVHSINTSGHKYGLVSAGLGWIIWRSEDYLPKHLVFELKYLGGVEQSFTLNFSRPGHQVIQQYYNFIHLGLDGYRRIQRNSLANARLLSNVLESTGYFVCVSEVHRKKGLHSYLPGIAEDSDDPENYNAGLPVVAWRLSDDFKKKYPHVRQASISTMLRVKGYIIPNYPLPSDEADVEILRVVVRESMSADLLEQLCDDIVVITESLKSADTIDLAALAHPLQQIQEQSHIARAATSLGSLSEPGSTTHLPQTKSHRHGHYKGVC
ncbi:pyridoxal phosphate-dependent transferase [Lipomyces tetrasporus]|uniref:Glutamate decarboxylase n=1 Tax=Lipomyces tetrasporus TaxID=54092 RepID=A0AAD7QM66_9ASCO|nr:pyridoxal phosphate-dependent transferase [Lipomyces tetrasporus]KAJ8097545.1 pyridoxal phosphate-dependent transferase [Lipomyces tetrasporus]